LFVQSSHVAIARLSASEVTRPSRRR
jgi:hypothetical protein